MRHFSTIILCIASICQVSFANNQGDLAEPLKDIYIPILEERRPVGKTIPLKTYPLIAETENGYIIALEDATYAPPLGYLKKYNRLRNPIASAHGRELRIKPMINEPIYSGYIPFEQSKRYMILGEGNGKLHLQFRALGIVATGIVNRVDCTIVPGSTIYQEQEEARKSQRDFEAALSASEYGKDYENAVRQLRNVVEMYPTHRLMPHAKKRLREIDNDAYRRALDGLELAETGKNDPQALNELKASLEEQPLSVIREEIIKMIEVLEARIIVEAPSVIDDKPAERSTTTGSAAMFPELVSIVAGTAKYSKPPYSQREKHLPFTVDYMLKRLNGNLHGTKIGDIILKQSFGYVEELDTFVYRQYRDDVLYAVAAFWPGDMSAEGIHVKTTKDIVFDKYTDCHHVIISTSDGSESVLAWELESGPRAVNGFTVTMNDDLGFANLNGSYLNYICIAYGAAGKVYK